MNEKRLIQRFMTYVGIDSETLSEGVFSRHLADELAAMGLEVSFDNAGAVIGSDGNNLIARLKGDMDCPPIILSAHMDTVTPGKGITPVIDNGIIRSGGDTILGADDKGGIASIVEAVQMLIESGESHPTVELIFTIAEEGGLKGAKNLDMELVTGREGFVFDSGGAPGEIVVRAPYQDKLEVKIFGRPAHAGICPEEGVNAIQVVARAIQNMNLLRIDEETTANIGIIRGGEATNIVCPEVVIKAEARSLTESKLLEQTRHMMECFEEACQVYGAKADIQVYREYGGYAIGADHPLLNFAEGIITSLGLPVVRATSGGGADANILNNRGLQLLNLGTGMSKCHTLEEFVAIKDLKDMASLIYKMVLAWNTKK